MGSVGDDLVLGELLGQVEVLLLLRGHSEVVASAGHLVLRWLLPGGGGGKVPDPGSTGEAVELLEQ